MVRIPISISFSTSVNGSFSDVFHLAAGFWRNAVDISTYSVTSFLESLAKIDLLFTGLSVFLSLSPSHSKKTVISLPKQMALPGRSTWPRMAPIWCQWSSARGIGLWGGIWRPRHHQWQRGGRRHPASAGNSCCCITVKRKLPVVCYWQGWMGVSLAYTPGHTLQAASGWKASNSIKRRLPPRAAGGGGSQALCVIWIYLR